MALGDIAWDGLSSLEFAKSPGVYLFEKHIPRYFSSECLLIILEVCEFLNYRKRHFLTWCGFTSINSGAIGQCIGGKFICEETPWGPGWTRRSRRAGYRDILNVCRRRTGRSLGSPGSIFSRCAIVSPITFLAFYLRNKLVAIIHCFTQQFPIFGDAFLGNRLPCLSRVGSVPDLPYRLSDPAGPVARWYQVDPMIQ